MSARFEASSADREIDRVITESNRVIVAVLEASPTIGNRVNSFRALWPDGREVVQIVRWNVESPLKLIPRTLAIRADEGIAERTITVRSTKRPFRILGIEGPSVLSHRIQEATGGMVAYLTVRLDAAKAGSLSRIVVRTDCDDAREVIINLIGSSRGN